MANNKFKITTLGDRKVKSPIKLSTEHGDSIANFVRDDDFVIYDISAAHPGDTVTFSTDNLLEKAGPRELVYFQPKKVRAGIVTCGGLCPGLNDVIRAIVRTLWFRYGVNRITGIRNGYKGFLADYHIEPMDLYPGLVEDIHNKGGTILGSARGGGDVEEIVDTLESMNMNMLFTIGGDGTQAGALEISKEIEKRGLKIAVVGVPKTIDNDLSFIEKSFGFETAVSIAVDAVASAHIEAVCAINGVGLVKVMGRESGFIAAHTAIANNDVNFVLIPEVDFDLEGENGLLVNLKKRLEKRNHAVILVAEGAGQRLMEKINGTDESGNKKLGDIGLFLKDQIKEYFKKEDYEAHLKYIDPSYMIRSAPAHPNDSIYCARLGAHAVHAAMAGKTGVLISLINGNFVHVPIQTAVAKRNFVDPEGPLWRDVLESTRQPVLMKN